MDQRIDPLINIMNYENLPTFLREFYTLKKQNDANFSYEKWSRALGAKNRTYLQLMVAGKRKVNDQYRHMFLNYFRFSPDESNHFLDLANLSLTRAGDIQRSLQNRLDRRKARREVQILNGHEAFMSNIKIPALLGLLSFKDITCTLDLLAEKINESKETVREWIKILEDLQLAAFDEATQSWKTTVNQFIMPTDAGGKALHDYHRICLESAVDSCKITDRSRTQLQGFTFAVNAEQLKELHLRAQEMAHNLVVEYDSDELQDRELYQWTWSFFPIAGK